MVALPSYSVGNALNFQPVQNALTQVTQTNALNRQFGLQQEQLGLQKQQVASQLKGAALDQEAKYAQLTGGIAQSALDSKDPTKIQAAWGQLKNSHPEFVSNLVAHGIDPNDATGGLTFITNEARGYMNPLDVEAKKAQIADLTSQAQYRQGQLGLMKRQIDMGQRLFNGADTSQPTATGPKPGDVDSGYRFKGGNLEILTHGSQCDNGRTLGEVPERGAGGSTRHDGYYDNFARQPSNALPNPGDPTSFSGGTPAGNVTPGKYGPDTMRALGIDIAVNGGKGASTIINNDPGQQYARTYANKVAEDNANVADLQNAVMPLLRRVEDFRNIARNAGPDVLQKATGPDYSGGYSYLPLPDTASPMYQNARQLLQHLNPFSDQESYHKATNANLEMTHLKDAISASFKQLPGSGKGGATDQAQRTVDNMLGHAMNAQDPETFFKIAHDAMNTIRGFARLPDEDASTGSVPTGGAWGGQAPSQAAPQQQSAPRPRAVNPQTGHAVEWNGSQWVDAQ